VLLVIVVLATGAFGGIRMVQLAGKLLEERAATSGSAPDDGGRR
jgi:hypothetical protein